MEGAEPLYKKEGLWLGTTHWILNLGDFLQVHIHSVAMSKGGASTKLRSGFLVGNVTHPGRKGSIIREIQSKTEMWSPPSKKQEKKCCFLSFLVSLSLSLTTCHGV